MSASTLDQFGLTVCRGAEQVARGFTSPDDDWSQIAFLHSCARPEPGCRVTVVPAATEDFPSRILRAIHHHRPQAVCTVTSGWYAEPEPDAPLLPASEYEDRREVVLVHAIDREVDVLWLAFVLRDGEQPPVLSDWSKSRNAVHGRMVDPIRDALR